MGKSLQAISLVLARPVAQTLIICPVVALMQWRDQIAIHTEQDALKVLIYHGQDRDTDTASFEDYAVVLTTYSVVEVSQMAVVSCHC